MTCKGCIHYDVCIQKKDMEKSIEKTQMPCTNFIDKSRFIELPCKAGAEIFIIIDDDEFPSYVDLGTVVSFAVQEDGIWIFARYECGLTYWHRLDDLGKGYWLNPKEAEKALKERES